MLFILANDQVRERAAAFCKIAPAGQWVRFTEPVKSREQEEKYHALIAEIAERHTLYGQKLPAESWKRLLIDAFKHDTLTDADLGPLWAKFGAVQLLPALNHPGVVMVGEQSRNFPKKLASAFIEWLSAFDSRDAKGVAETETELQQ